MEFPRYQDFEIKIVRADRAYRAHVLRSPAGDATHAFTLPLDERDIELLILKMGRRRGPPVRGLKSSPQMEAAVEFGSVLFASVFANEIRARLRSSLDQLSKTPGQGLRIKLRLDEVPELADLPWEFVFDDANKRFLAQSHHTPIVRYIEMAEPIRPLAVALPLNVLVMISSPRGVDPLDVAREKALLERAVAPLAGRGKVRVDFLADAKLRTLRRTLRRDRYHVFHYIGHGGFDKVSGEGVLLLEDEDGGVQITDAHRLGMLMHDHRSLRLAVLNACEGARNSPRDPYAGVATMLVKQGVPAVVAMQFAITDRAAIAFSDELYVTLVEGFPIDAAVAEARKAVYLLPSEVEWGTPVLYMRSSDGTLFELSGRDASTSRPAPAPATTPTSPPVRAEPARRDNESLGVVHTALADVAPMRFIGLTGGEFTMGSPLDEKDRFDDEVPHRVRVSGFEIGEHPVTQKQWEAVMGTNPSPGDFGRGDDLPVHNISWFDAIEFMKRLSEREGLQPCYVVAGEEVNWTPGCNGYRLPTEAEWEYAARAGTQTAYAFGDDAARLGEYAWHDENSGKKVHAAGTRKPNAWGIYDMHGNVWEWVWDWYGPYDVKQADRAVRDPEGPTTAEAPLVDIPGTKQRSKTLRGGSLVNRAGDLRSALRGWIKPSFRFRYGGLRCVRSARCDTPTPEDGNTNATTMAREKLGRSTNGDTTLNPDEVLHKINSAYMRGLKRCHSELLEKDPSAGGTVSLRFTVGSKGRITRVQAKGFHSSVDRCIEKRAKSWRFGVPKDDDGEATDATFKIALAFHANSQGGAMDVPDEYVGREQSFLKHRVLQEYLDAWGHKLGSLARFGKVKLWYVDCFAGPWKHHNEDLRDTSIFIGLRALEEASATWREKGHAINVGAIFVEKDKASYQQLRDYLNTRDSSIEAVAWHGEFGNFVPRIEKQLGDDPAFVFVDPTGFKGVAMRYIAPLMQSRQRDVLVNVMFNDINRFKDDKRDFLRTQMRDFFGLEDETLPRGLSENELLALYRQKLKRMCRVQYAADLAVPHPTHERTWFRLVIGGKHPEVLRLFRQIESKVIGREAASVRAGAKQRDRSERSGQLALGLDISPERDRWYDDQNSRDQKAAISALRSRVADGGRQRFDALWPEILEQHHITRVELCRLVLESVSAGTLFLESERQRRQTVGDSDWISLTGR